MKRVLYAIGSKFGGVGIGTTAYHGARGLYRHGMLQRLLCGTYRPTEIPARLIRAVGLPDRILRKLASYDNSGRLWHLQAMLFDLWAARHLERGDAFLVWGSYGLRCLQQARAMGMTTILQCASAHPSVHARLLAEEYARWHLRWSVSQATLTRVLAEIAEAHYILIPSDFVRETFLNERMPEYKLLQIPFGVDSEGFRPAPATVPHPFRILFVGQVSLRKGVPYLLEAWQRLSWQDAELWLAGSVASAMQGILRQYSDLIGVRFLGHIAHPVSVYQQADVFIFPTIEEGSALVTYEALACGLPVVTTPNAGSVVQDGVQGFIVPIRNAEALAAAMDRLHTDERLRREMGRAARLRAEEFSWARHGDVLARRLELLDN